MKKAMKVTVFDLRLKPEKHWEDLAFGNDENSHILSHPVSFASQ